MRIVRNASRVHSALVLLVAAASPTAGRLQAIAGRIGRGLGGDYCVQSEPDFSCYPSGFPSCCGEANHAAACPETTPPCETPYYCDSDPDEACYVDGWPKCCGDGGCPSERPSCDITTSTTTTTFTTTTTTTEAPYQFPEQGPPEGEVDDPSEAMPAEDFVPPYCNNEENFECYSDGKPECCEDPDSCTSLTSPPCEVTSTSSTTPDGGGGLDANSTAIPISGEGVVANASSTPGSDVVAATGTSATSSSDGVMIFTTLPSATGSGIVVNSTAPSSSVVEADEATESPTSSPTDGIDASAASALCIFRSVFAAVAATSVTAALAAR